MRERRFSTFPTPARAAPVSGSGKVTPADARLDCVESYPEAGMARGDRVTGARSAEQSWCMAPVTLPLMPLQKLHR